MLGVCGLRSKIKAPYFMLSSHLVNRKASNDISAHPPAPPPPYHLLLLRIRSLSLATLLINQTRYRSCLSLTSRLQLPASLQNYSDEPITSSQGNQRASHSFDTTKPVCHSNFLFTLFLSAILCGIQCPPPPCYVYMQLINCSPSHQFRVRCVFNHSHNFRVRILTSPAG